MRFDCLDRPNLLKRKVGRPVGSNKALDSNRMVKAKTGLISPKRWEAIVRVFARHQCQTVPIALELGWDEQRVRRVFRRGYPSKGYPPIKTLLAMDALATDEIRAQRNEIEESLPPSEPIASVEEVERKAVVISDSENARVRMMVRREEERERSRNDAIKARAEEAMLISINRKNAIAMNGVTQQVMRGALALSEKLQQAMLDDAANGNLTTSQMLSFVRSAASIARFNSEVTVLSVKAERAVLGQPIDAPGDMPAGDANLDDAVQWIELASKVIGRAKDRGILGSGDGKKAS